MCPTLITEEQRAQLLANGRSGYAGDLLPVVRLFTPDAHATWLLAALDPADGDTAYGLCDVGIGMPELGHVKLSDLASIVGPLKRPILRDLYFHATRPLSAYAQLAQLDGSIPDSPNQLARSSVPAPTGSAALHRWPVMWNLRRWLSPGRSKV